MEYDPQLKLAEFKINGFTLASKRISSPRRSIDGLCAAFMPLLEHVRARETEIGAAEVGDLRRRQGPHAAGLPLHPELAARPAVPSTRRSTPTTVGFSGFSNRLLGDRRLPDHLPALEQPVAGQHPAALAPGHEAARPPASATRATLSFGVKIPLVDTSEENGSIEVLPCTQYLAEADLEGRYDELLCRGDRRAPAAPRHAPLAPSGCRTRAPSIAAPPTPRTGRGRSW